MYVYFFFYSMIFLLEMASDLCIKLLHLQWSLNVGYALVNMQECDVLPRQ